MTTLKHKSLYLIREEGSSYIYSADVQTQPIQNNWISVEGYSTGVNAQPMEITITEPADVIVGKHMDRIEMTMTDIINKSPRLLKEIMEAREGLKHETLLDDKDIFGK